MSKYWNSDKSDRKTHFLGDEINWKLCTENFTFFFLLLFSLTGIFKADYNLTILNFEGVLLVFCGLKTNAFKSWRNILIYTRYCFSSMRKSINGLEILALYLIHLSNQSMQPNNPRPNWKCFRLYSGKRK